MTEKPCSTCGELLPLSAFNRDRSRRDGRQRHCRSCSREHAARYRAVPEHAERMREQAADWRRRRAEHEGQAV